MGEASHPLPGDAAARAARFLVQLSKAARMFGKLFNVFLAKFALLLLIAALIAALPIWRHSARWGFVPAVVIAILIVIVYVFARLGRI